MQMQHVRLFGFRRAGTLPALQGSHGPGTEVEPEGVKVLTDGTCADRRKRDVGHSDDYFLRDAEQSCLLNSDLFTMCV